MISRQRAIAWIQGWKQENLFYNPHSKCKTIPFDEVIARLEEVPSAVETTMKRSSDTVEVVRCKDCKFAEDCEIAYRFGEQHDWFCADGERRTDDA